MATCIENLRLFNEKVAELSTCTFTTKMRDEQTGFMARWEVGSGWDHLLVGPQGESVDAMFLTLRMVMQDNDRISIRRIAECYDETSADGALVREFNDIRQRLNQFLDDRKTGMKLFDKHHTNREAIELLLYGSRGHVNEAKHNELQVILDSPMAGGLFMNAVNQAVAVMISHLQLMASINNRVIAAAEAS